MKDVGDAPITIVWKQQDYTAEIEKILPDEYPDLAILHVHPPPPNHPCVDISDSDLPHPGNELYSFGYPDEHPYRNGDSAYVTYEGPTGEPTLLKFRSSQIRPGMSGSPLLNMRTGTVCGIIKLSRDITTHEGGRAIPIDAVFEAWPDIRQLHNEYHLNTPFPSSPYTLISDAIQTFEAQKKPVFVLYGKNRAASEEIRKAFSDTYCTSSNEERLHIALDMGKIGTEVSNSFEGIISEIVYQIVTQCLDQVPTPDLLYKTSYRLEQLIRKYRNSNIEPEKLKGFLEWVVCPDLKEIWKEYSSIVISIQHFEKAYDWRESVYEYIITPFLAENYIKQKLRFVFWTAMATQPLFYSGSNQQKRQKVLEHILYYNIPSPSWKEQFAIKECDALFFYVNDDIAEKQKIEGIAEKLKQRGVNVYFVDELILPGDVIQNVLPQMLSHTEKVVVFIGHSMLWNWQIDQLKNYTGGAIKRGLSVIPVLLPGVAKFPEDEQLRFLQKLRWVRFRESIDESEVIDELVWGIRG